MESATENRLPMADTRLRGREAAKSRFCSEKGIGSGDGETVRVPQGHGRSQGRRVRAHRVSGNRSGMANPIRSKTK